MKFLQIDGGIGRCICATGAVKEMTDSHLVTSAPFVFEGLGIERVYPTNHAYLYEDMIMPGEFILPEPYNHSKYYREKKHLCQVFNFLINGKDEYVAPEIKLSDNERINGRKYVEDIKKGKKVLLIQPFASSGGRTANCSKVCNDLEDESYRSFTDGFIKELIEALKDDYTLLFVEDANQKKYPNTVPVIAQSPRLIFTIIPFVDGIITCDSFLHHASAALGTPTTTIVLWGGTSEENLGYKEHINLRAKPLEVSEPNRIVHDHNYYLNKNKGINDFTSLLDEIKKNL